MTAHNQSSDAERFKFWDNVLLHVEPKDRRTVQMIAAAMRTERIDALPLFLEYALRGGIKEYTARQLWGDTKPDRNALVEVLDLQKAVQNEELNTTASLDELLECDANEPDIEFTTDLLTPLQDVTLLSANGGVGKTTLALLWLVCIAEGQMFFDLKTTRSPVLFVTAEDRRIVCAKRLAAICASKFLHWKNQFTQITRDNFHLWEILGKPLWTEDRKSAAGVPTSTMLQLERHIKATRARQVIIDNNSSVFCANFNDPVPVTAFLTHLRRLSERTYCNILLLGHVNADTASGGKSKTYFGSSAWHNAVRSRIFMELIPAGSGVDEHIRVVHEKSNYGKLAQPFNLKRDVDTGVLRLLSAHEIATALDGNLANIAAQVLADIKAITERGEHVVASMQGPTNFYSCLSNHFPNKYPERDRKTKGEVKQAIQRLRSENVIEQCERQNQHRKTVSVLLPRA